MTTPKQQVEIKLAPKIESQTVKYLKRRIQIESDVAKIGPNNTPTVQVKRFVVKFLKPFRNIPQVTANTLQDPIFPINAINDTFAVSITSITREGFTGQVVRVDQDSLPSIRISLDVCSAVARPALPTWSQDLSLSWIAVGK